MLQRSAKILLQNELRHTGTHNRMVEEAEMWRQKEKKSLSSSSKKDKDRDKDKEKDKEKEKKNSSSIFFEDTRKSFLYDNRIRDDTVSYGKCRAHMDDEPFPLSTTRSTYWMRQLQKAEEKDPGRWGHSGYKELYPEEFRSDRSEDEENGHHHHHHHHRRKRSSRKRRKEKKRRHHYRSRSDDSRSDSGPRRKRRKSTGCSKHRKHRRSRDLSSGSETVRYIRRKIRKERRRRKHKPRRICDTDIDIKPQLHTSNSPVVGRRHRSTSSSSRRGGGSTRERSSMHDHRQSRHMSTDNTDSGAEEAGSKRQKFQRDYSSSDSEDSYCMS
ncbi:unnamed protein product [Acanthosepion pharaonis]|uniref:Uncharacterized protein n=1 Tax=Acanthosepion pharaonis TaxID=158019 RepID=A0A812BFA7_ACAPH|nr:unnamed protein product [Sepia pharaonis]